MLKIIKASERMNSAAKINIALLGPSGVGKTTQARTLPPETTLFVDLEAGTLSLEGSKENPPWQGDVVKIRDLAQEMGLHPWEVTKAVTCLITGIDPLDEEGTYSQDAYQYFSKTISDPKVFEKYDTVFIDSITVASRWAFSWSKREIARKTGKQDNRAAYGLLGQEMITWLTNVQHCKKNVITAGILDEKKDGIKTTWEPQIEGSMTGLQLPGIFDEVITLGAFETEEGEKYRAFICQMQNDWKFPAKDRSGCLEMMEPPDLGALMKKIRAGKRIDGKVITTLPTISQEAA